jgi:preprotein translocase subunit Sss1
MIARQARDRRLQTAVEALGIGFFYIGILAFVVYTLRQVLESGLL